MATTSETQHRLANTTFPVELPDCPELQAPKEDFARYIHSLLLRPKTAAPEDEEPATAELVVRTKTDEAGMQTDGTTDSKPESASAFMTGLLADDAAVPSFDDRDGKMLTENADVAHRTSKSPLVDAFYELEDVISADRLADVLLKSWNEDPDSTLKIIWNARSIHLGKSSRSTFYRAVGWLYANHTATLIANLPWLVRPLIPKKAPKKDEKDEKDDLVKIEAKDADDDFEMVDAEKDEPEGQPQPKKIKLNDDAELSEFDVKYGVAHGYWKDILNILALAVNGELKVDGDVRSILNVERPKEKAYKRDWTQGRKKAITADRHQRAVEKLENDSVYKALHLSVARLFADQLRLDAARLETGSKQDLKAITLAAKWAPSHKGFHDQHTCVVSSIAESLYSFDNVCPQADPADRKTYLAHAREAYQTRTLSKLRKHLQIVERPITAERFEDIKYERVPSLAMKQYTPLFARKDFDRFDKYIDDVAQGKVSISGATLLPSTLVKAVHEFTLYRSAGKQKSNALVEKKMMEIQAKSIGGQWNTLVQRIKDSGTLESSIAVCDVSGSMGSPQFKDGTTPMHSAIGLSLLLAEVTKPPFGGAFITFSANPEVLRVGGPEDKRSFKEKVEYIQSSVWSMNTNFVAVFEKLILPMALENRLTQEDMVKQIFVFSDMQFDSAQRGIMSRWTTSYERIQKKFREAGYEMPKLVFWNLAGGRAGYESGSAAGDDTAPKPVTAADEGTALVSGYSQGQLKMFLDNGQFEDPEAEEEDAVEQKEDGEAVVLEKKEQKKQQDPLAVMRKAISHPAYRMLKVVD